MLPLDCLTPLQVRKRRTISENSFSFTNYNEFSQNFQQTLTKKYLWISCGFTSSNSKYIL